MKHNYRLTMFLLPIILVLSACGSQSIKKAATEPLGQSYIENLDFNLSFKIESEAYYTEEEMKQYVLKKVTDTLSQKGILGTPGAGSTGLDVRVSYYRAFSGELTPWPSKSITRPIVNWGITATKNGVVLAKMDKINQTYQGSLLENLATTVTMDLGQNTKKSENKYLDSLANTIANWVVRNAN